MRDEIVLGMRLGMTFKLAADAAGIGESTLMRWKALGEQAKAPKIYREFRESLDGALAQGARRHLLRIEKAAEKDEGRSSIWWLKTMYPDIYGDRQKVTHEGAVTFSLRDLDQLEAVARQNEA